MKKVVLCLLFMQCGSASSAQTFIRLDAQPFHTAVDRPGDFYVIDANRKIKKFSATGILITETTLEDIPDAFDPWSGVRLFLYHKNKREIHYLNPSLELLTVVQIDSAFAIEPVHSCPSGEYNYWLFDMADKSIKKIITPENKVSVEVVIGDYLSNAGNVLAMREYLNYVFILDKEKGILIFNTLGIFIRQIPVKVNSFGFYGEELYYLTDHKLIFMDLYTGATTEKSIPEPADKLLLSENKMIIIRDRMLKFLDFKR